MGPQTKAMTGLGWACSGFIIVMMLYGASMKLRCPEEVREHMVDKFGYPQRLVAPLGIVEIVCVGLYVVPRTTFLGAVLLTGYLGGGLATHVRIQEGFFDAALYGILVWLGLYLRDPQFRDVLGTPKPATRSPPSLLAKGVSAAGLLPQNDARAKPVSNSPP